MRHCQLLPCHAEILFFAFSLGILLMLASILMFVYFRYSDVECYVMIAITGASTLAVLCVYIVPHRWVVAPFSFQAHQGSCWPLKYGGQML